MTATVSMRRLSTGHYCCYLSDGRYAEAIKDPDGFMINRGVQLKWHLKIDGESRGYFPTVKLLKQRLWEEFIFMKVLHIHGRRWTSRVGTTYCTARIYIDGEHAHTTEQHSGYGDYYIQVATEWLEKNGYLPDLRHHKNGGTESLWQYCARTGIKYVAYADDFSREKDL